MQRRPRQRRVERRVEQLLDPGGIQVLGLAVPGVAQRPDAALRRARPRRLVGVHGDLARDRAALGRRVGRARASRCQVPAAGLRDLGEPEIRRPAVPLARRGRDVAVGRDQRQLALERLLGGEDDAQRRALPRRERRGQDRELGRVFAAAAPTLGLRVHDRGKEDERCACDQRQCCRGSSKPVCWKQLSPRPGPQTRISGSFG